MIDKTIDFIDDMIFGDLFFISGQFENVSVGYVKS